MLNFENGDKVTLTIGGLRFARTVLEIDGFAVYLAEGGDAFDARTGRVWGSDKTTKTISHAA